MPPEFAGNSDGYIDRVCNEILPAIAREGLADAVDAFCEKIAFSAAQTRRVFETARRLGLPVKLHAEQLSDQGGTQLATEFNALSCDHLEYASDAGIADGQGRRIAVLLPGAFYALRETKLPPDRPLPSGRRADRHFDRPQSRHLAHPVAAADAEHGARPSSE